MHTAPFSAAVLTCNCNRLSLTRLEGPPQTGRENVQAHTLGQGALAREMKRGGQNSVLRSTSSAPAAFCMQNWSSCVCVNN
ncbi:unnamed protein product [Caretta caretta]